MDEPDADGRVLLRQRVPFRTRRAALEANLDPDAQLFAPRFSKHVERTAKAGCRLKRVPSGMFKHAAASDGKLSAFEAFLEYVHDNFEEVKAEIDKINGRADKKLAKEQAAHAKKKARESGQSVPSADFRVPGSRAPGSGVRPSRRGPGSRSAAASGPPTVMSARFA